jgi:hypothetical protein
MNLHDEALRLVDYAVYPNIGNNLTYPVLGFIDELFGEYFSDEHRMKEEILDVYWYLNQISYELSLLYGSSFDRHLNWSGRLVSKEEASQSIGVLCGIAKKIMRDGTQSAHKKRDLALVSLSVLADFVHSELYQNNIGLPDAISSLHEKLGSRQERGVIQGDGNYR